MFSARCLVCGQLHARSKRHLSETADFWPQKYYVIVHKQHTQQTLCDSNLPAVAVCENNQHPWQYKRTYLTPAHPNLESLCVFWSIRVTCQKKKKKSVKKQL